MDFRDPEYLRTHCDGIFRIASYRRTIYQRLFTETSTGDSDGIRESMLRPNRTPTVGLGRLDILPNELLLCICELVDIKTLFRFRQVNLHAQETVSSMFMYRAVMEHALEAFYACLRTQLAPWYSIRDLFDVLCTRECVLCGSFGNFIFLPTFTKCCFSCLEVAPQLRVLRFASVLKAYTHLRRSRVRKSIPVLKSIPGVYQGFSRKQPLLLVSEIDIMKYLGDAYKPEHSKPEMTYNMLILRHMATTAIPYFDKTSGDTESGVSCRGCQFSEAERRGLITEIADDDGDAEISELEDFGLEDTDFEESGSTDFEESNSTDSGSGKVFTRDGFMKHFRRCRYAQAIWYLSKDGTSPVQLLDVLELFSDFSLLLNLTTCLM